MEFGILFRRVCVMNLILILFHPICSQGKEPYLCGFVLETLTIASIQTFAVLVISNLIDDTDH